MSNRSSSWGDGQVNDWFNLQEKIAESFSLNHCFAAACGFPVDLGPETVGNIDLSNFHSTCTFSGYCYTDETSGWLKSRKHNLEIMNSFVDNRITDFLLGLCFGASYTPIGGWATRSNVIYSVNIKNSLGSSAPFSASLSSNIRRIYKDYILRPIRCLIRPFFLPLFIFHWFPAKYVVKMKKEEQFFTGFWDPNTPCYPELSHHKRIKELFTHQKVDFSIFLKGLPCKVRCCVIESKDIDPQKECCTVVHVLGMGSTINNTIMHTYPLLAAYLDVQEKKPPVRFILIDHYSTISLEGVVHTPETLTEAGFLLSETLKSIEATYGTIHQLLSYSVGSVVTAAALKYFHTFMKSSDATALKPSRAFKSLPKNMVFDRGPSCVTKLSNGYIGGSILLQLAKLSGWDINVGKEISNFVDCCKGGSPAITILNALNDHRFSLSSTLYSNPDIAKLVEEKKATSLLLDICAQIVHENAQHSFGLGNWYGSHIVGGGEKQDFLPRDRNLAEAIIRTSLF